MSKATSSRQHPWTIPQPLPLLDERAELTRSMVRPPPGDFISSSGGGSSSNNNNRPTAKTMGRAELARRKNEYFEEAFALRSSGADRHPQRERIRSDSIVLLELKTNVIVGDEFIFITELSAKLAERYQRPLSAIAVHVQHSQCIFFAGTFEPAYTATISALPSYLLPATNRRNAFVLSEHLEEALGVPQSRGLISFLPMPEDNMACNGKTVSAMLDETLDDPAGYAMGVIEEEKATSFGSRRKRLSVKVSAARHPLPVASATDFPEQEDCVKRSKAEADPWYKRKQSLTNIRTASAAGGYEMTPPTSAEDNAPVGGEERPVKVAKRRKSFVAGLFGRSNGRKENEKQPADAL